MWHGDSKNVKDFECEKAPSNLITGSFVRKDKSGWVTNDSVLKFREEGKNCRGNYWNSRDKSYKCYFVISSVRTKEYHEEGGKNGYCQR